MFRISLLFITTSLFFSLKAAEAPAQSPNQQPLKKWVLQAMPLFQFQLKDFPPVEVALDMYEDTATGFAILNEGLRRISISTQETKGHYKKSYIDLLWGIVNEQKRQKTAAAILNLSINNMRDDEFPLSFNSKIKESLLIGATQALNVPCVQTLLTDGVSPNAAFSPGCSKMWEEKLGKEAISSLSIIIKKDETAESVQIFTLFTESLEKVYNPRELLEHLTKIGIKEHWKAHYNTFIEAKRKERLAYAETEIRREFPNFTLAQKSESVPK